MKTFILHIFKKDARYKSGKRLCGSYPFQRKDRAAMDQEVKELTQLYQSKDGYTLIIE